MLEESFWLLELQWNDVLWKYSALHALYVSHESFTGMRYKRRNTGNVEDFFSFVFLLLHGLRYGTINGNRHPLQWETEDHKNAISLNDTRIYLMYMYFSLNNFIHCSMAMVHDEKVSILRVWMLDGNGLPAKNRCCWQICLLVPKF